jgi:YVTN family beta-propeller protein
MMKHVLVSAALAFGLLGATGVSSMAQVAFVPDGGSSRVSVVDTTSNTVLGTIPVGAAPFGVAITPDGSKVYVGNQGSNTVSVIDAATYALVATIPVNIGPSGMAITPDGKNLYVGSYQAPFTVTVIDTATTQ